MSPPWIKEDGAKTAETKLEELKKSMEDSRMQWHMCGLDVQGIP